MSIIIILIAMLVPSLNAVRRYAKVVLQNGQFHDISKGLEVFSADFDGYPDSSCFDSNSDSYCGAMKLCEALVGQDGMGFHPDSVFDDEGKSGTTELYYVRTSNTLDSPPTSPQKANLRDRKLYLEGETVQVASIVEILGDLKDFSAANGGWSVLCDAFKRNDIRRDGEKLGMPVLYYRADPTQLTHQYDQMATNIYRYSDNHELLAIQPPWITDPNDTHPLYDSSVSSPVANGGQRFYEMTTNPDVIVKMGSTTYPQPYNRDSYILISAGWDGLYGTKDDVFNFAD
jgi:hypothetical protein